MHLGPEKSKSMWSHKTMSRGTPDSPDILHTLTGKFYINTKWDIAYARPGGPSDALHFHFIPTPSTGIKQKYRSFFRTGL